MKTENYIAEPGRFLVVRVLEDPDCIDPDPDFYLGMGNYPTLEVAKSKALECESTFSSGQVYNDQGRLVYNAKRGFFSN